VNDLVYIGQTIRDVGARFAEHCHPGQAKREFLSEAIQEIGREHFYVEVLESGLESQREMNYREAYYVSTLRTVWPDGYNLTVGGTWGREFRNTKKPPRQEFIDAYQAGFSLSEIADYYKCSPTGVWKHLKKAGVETRPCGNAPGESNRWDHTKRKSRSLDEWVNSLKAG
jgi:hypothetical protein